MRRIVRNRPSPAMVVALISLFIAMGGTAAALSGHNTVFSDDIVRKEVHRSDIDGSAVNSGKVENGSLKATDLGLVATGSFNLGSVAAASCVNAANVSIAGADGNDLLLVVPTDNGSIQEANFDNAGELIMLGIPHPGESHVKVCNVSGNAIDPGEQGYQMLLIEG